MEDMSIREILEQVGRGQVRIPAFQRGFVWEPERVAYLMDSIYKKYPFGSLLLWRTKEVLNYDRNLGPFTLPDPKDDYPVDYVLDGQQRITSIFGVFQTELEMSSDVTWYPIYFDLKAEESAQESQFVALKDEEVDQDRHFPLKTFFNTTAYRAACKQLPDSVVDRIDKIQEAFKETSIPVQISRTEDKATVAIIFERVNRQGVELDTLQLLSAWTWSEEFQLHDQFLEFADELKPFGFSGIGADSNLLLRACAAVLTHDASPQALMALQGSQVRDNFDCFTNGMKHAVDYLRNNFNIEKLENLPFVTILIPLATFFAVSGNKEISVDDTQRRRLNRWFWRTCFSKRYSSAVQRNLNADIQQIVALRLGEDSTLGNFPSGLWDGFFLENEFNFSSVNTKTFVLLLASAAPRSFISGSRIDLRSTLKEANRMEFHHLMPRSFVRSTKQTSRRENALANFAFLSRADNRKLGGASPSGYRKHMPENVDDILTSAMCPESLFLDNFEKFLDERTDILHNAAIHLCEDDKKIISV